MIIWIFLIWLSLSIVLMVIGLWTDDQILQVVGFGVLWIPAFAMSGINAPFIEDTPGVQYIHGYNSTTTYTYVTNSTNIVDTTEAHTPLTQTYSNRLYGILLIFMAVFGMILGLGEMRKVAESDGPQGWRPFK